MKILGMPIERLLYGAFMFILGSMISLIRGAYVGEERVRAEAIKAGAAEYVLIDPSRPYVQFTWKPTSR